MMEKIIVNKIKSPRLSNPVFIVGLPGIGNIGKIAVEYLIDKLKMIRMTDIVTQYLPPQVFINEEGLIHLAKNSIYYKKRINKNDLVVVTGDFQGTTQEGQYELSYRMLEFLKKYEVSMIYTLGGYSVGKIVEKPRVLGAVTDKKLIKPLARKGVVFSEGEPSGGIVGSAGLILGMGTELFSIPGACFMGETSGYFADPKSAREIIMVLAKVLKTRINLKDIDEKTRQLEDITEKMKQEAQNKAPKDDLGYFG